MRNKRKIVRIVTFGGLGDSMMLTPCLKALKAVDSQLKIVIYCSKPLHRETFTNNPYVYRTLGFNPRHKLFRKFCKKLEDSRIGRWLGYKSSFKRIDYAVATPCRMMNVRHVSEIMADMLGVGLSDYKPELYLTPGELAGGRSRLSEFKRPIVAIHTRSSKIIKDWPRSRWEKLVAMYPDLTFIQIGTPKEEDVVGSINCRGSTLRQSFAMIANADYFLGIDSSMAHVAAAFDIPRLVIYGPASPAIWGQRGGDNIYLALNCSPCVDFVRREPCPFGNTCITGITVEVVEERFRQLLAQRKMESAPCADGDKSESFLTNVDERLGERR